MSNNKLSLKANDNYNTGIYSEKKEYYDVAVSRYYYYLYQNIIAYINDTYKDFTIPKGEDTHKFTIEFLQRKIIEAGKIELSDLSNLSLLHKLRRSRNLSDYQGDKIETIIKFRNEFKDNFEIVEAILKEKSIIRRMEY